MTLSPLFDDALRLAAAIACESLALVIWNVAARSPQRLLSDLRRAFSSPGRLLAAALVTLLGAVFALSGIALLLPVLVNGRADLSTLATGAFLIALLIDFLVGHELRGLMFRRNDP